MENKKLIHFKTQHILSKDQAPIVIIIATSHTRIKYTIKLFLTEQDTILPTHSKIYQHNKCNSTNSDSKLIN